MRLLCTSIIEDLRAPDSPGSGFDSASEIYSVPLYLFRKHVPGLSAHDDCRRLWNSFDAVLIDPNNSGRLML